MFFSFIFDLAGSLLLHAGFLSWQCVGLLLVVFGLLTAVASRARGLQ